MKIRYGICFSLIMLLLILMSCVSANDNVTLMDDKNTDLLSQAMIEGTICVSDVELTHHDSWYVDASAPDGCGSKDCPYNNFREALDNAHDGDSIYFAGGNAYLGVDNVGLEIDKQLNLMKYGEGEVIFDGEFNSRIFTVSASCINITGLTFQNGKTDEAGGAIYFYNALSNSHINATYINNDAYEGGANYFRKSVSDSDIYATFINNTGKYGGANHFAGDVLNSLIRGEYVNNRASVRGGVNYFDGRVLNSDMSGKYSRNQARERGGSNYFYGSVSNLNIEGTYLNNEAYDGAVCNFNGDVSDTNITGSYIRNGAEGGSLISFAFTTSKVNVSNAIFLNSRYGLGGGEIYAKNDGVVANNNWFGNNITGYRQAPKVSDCVKVNTWLFLDAVRNLGNVEFFLMSYDAILKERLGYNNALLPEINLALSSTNTSIGKNRVVFNEQLNYTFSRNATITAQVENSKYTVEIIGALDALQDVINTACENSVIYLNHDYVYNELDNITEGVLIDKNITINGNGFIIDAKGKSRIFDVTAESINLTDVCLINGYAYSGGAISFDNIVCNSFINATFTNNTSLTEGGAICFYCEVVNSTICGTYINNTGFWSGGANRFDNVRNSKIGGTYVGNEAASYNGGANYFYGEVSDCDLSGTYMGNNAKDGINYFCYEVLKSNISGLYINNSACQGSLITFTYASSNVKISNGIFIKNTYGGVLIYAAQKGVSANNNWFGNNATDFADVLQKTVNVKMTSWLFLNGTGAHYKFKFFLMSYDNITKEISNYDNTVLPMVDLRLSAVNTTIHKDHALLLEETGFDCLTNVSITAQAENVGCTIKIGVGDFDLLQVLINSASENSVFSLNRNYTFNRFDGMTEGILIDKNITINGNGFTLDAKGKTRIFQVVSRSVNITNIVLKNGHAFEGGAIYFNNSIISSHINATFIGNTFSANMVGYGGAANYFNGEVLNSSISGTYLNNGGLVGNAINYFSVVKNSNIGGTYINNCVNSYFGGINYFGNVFNSNIGGVYFNNTVNYGGVNFFRDVVFDSNITGAYVENNARNAVIIYFDGNPKNVSISNAIFLNNEYSFLGLIYSYCIDYGVCANNNWFGNKVSDYGAVPKNTNVKMDNWLFLNATFNQSNVKFLMSYDAITGQISAYDKTLLSIVNLAFDGGANNFSDVLLNAIVGGLYINTTISAVFDVGARELVVSLVNNATAQPIKGAIVVIKIRGELYKVRTNASGQAVFSIDDVDFDSYVADVSYKGNTLYKPSNVKVGIVFKSYANLTAVYDAEAKEMVVTLVNNGTGAPLKGANVFVNIGGAKNKVSIDAAGKGKLSVAGLAPGSYDASITYKGSAMYYPAETSLEVVVVKGDYKY